MNVDDPMPDLPRLPATTLAAIIAFSGAALSQEDHSAHGDHGGMAVSTGPAEDAFRAANDAMHSDMALDYTGNPDADFIRGMIPHHEGAVAMARIVLEHGEDAEVRKLAEEVIAAQEAEIAWMQDWLAANGY